MFRIRRNLGPQRLELVDSLLQLTGDVCYFFFDTVQRNYKRWKIKNGSINYITVIYK